MSLYVCYIGIVFSYIGTLRRYLHYIVNVLTLLFDIVTTVIYENFIMLFLVWQVPVGRLALFVLFDAMLDGRRHLTIQSTYIL